MCSVAVLVLGGKEGQQCTPPSKRQLGVGHRPTATAAMIPGETQEILTSLRPNGGLQLGRRFAEEGVIAVTTVGLCRVGRQGRDKFSIKLGFDCSSLI